MELKPALYTLLTIIVLIVLGCINVAGKPLLAWLLFLFIGFICIGVIVSEIYDFFSGNTGAWLDIDL